MNGILLGIIIGIVIGKFIFPIIDSLKDVICLYFEERKNRIVYQVNILNNQNQNDTTNNTRTIGFKMNKEGETSNGKTNS